MTPEAAASFLTDVHVGVLAIDHPGHGPRALPIWYQFEAGDVVIGMGGTSLKAKLLRVAGRASLTVQTEAPPYKYVSVEGPVVVSDEQRDDLAMATRYLGPEMGKWYAENSPSTSASVLVRLTPEKWRTADFSNALG